MGTILGDRNLMLLKQIIGDDLSHKEENVGVFLSCLYDLCIHNNIDCFAGYSFYNIYLFTFVIIFVNSAHRHGYTQTWLIFQIDKHFLFGVVYCHMFDHIYKYFFTWIFIEKL